MSVTMVNGYACTTCAEIARAKRGDNPHKDGQSPLDRIKDKLDKAGRADQPAVLLGGSLADVLLAEAVQGASEARGSEANSARAGAVVDVVV